MEVNKEITLNNVVDKIYHSALFFNRIMDGGKKLEELDENTLLSRLKQQYLIAKEEVDETLQAIKDNDKIDLLDGIIDSAYVCPIFMRMLILHANKVGAIDLYKHHEDGKLYKKVVDHYIHDIPFESFPVEILDKAADAIIDNNMQKFTTKKEVFDTWESPYNRTSLKVDNTTYYFFTDNNFKVKKREGFNAVKLEDLFKYDLGGDDE